MQRRDWIESGLSLLTGAGLGAALMYLFDPDAGRERRDALGDSARHGLSSAGDHLAGAYESVSESAHGLRQRIGNRLHHLRDRSDQMGGHLRDSARHALHRGRHLSPRGHDDGFGAVAFVGTAIGTALAGATLMFLFDPRQGRRRRALIRDKGARMVHRATDAARAGAEHLRDRARGMYEEARQTGAAPGESDVCDVSEQFRQPPMPNRT